MSLPRPVSPMRVFCVCRPSGLQGLPHTWVIQPVGLFKLTHTTDSVLIGFSVAGNPRLHGERNETP